MLLKNVERGFRLTCPAIYRAHKDFFEKFGLDRPDNIRLHLRDIAAGRKCDRSGLLTPEFIQATMPSQKRRRSESLQSRSRNVASRTATGFGMPAHVKAATVASRQPAIGRVNL